MSDDLGKKLISTPYDDPYWNRVGTMNGKKVLGRQLTDDEFKEYSCSLWCFAPWIFDWDEKIVWRYQGE